MIKKTAYLPRYNWLIDFFADFTCERTDEVLDILEDMDCDDYHLYRAYSNMMGCDKNTGLAYSSEKHKKSVAVIYSTDSFKEFINTLTHECAHICAHITKCQQIKMREEEFCEMVGNLCGDVSDLIFEMSKKH